MDALFHFKLSYWLGRVRRFVNVSRHLYWRCIGQWSNLRAVATIT